jgi:uncharacterized protein
MQTRGRASPMRILDAHTHLSGPESGEDAQGILACMDECGIEKAFVIAPILDVRSWHLRTEHLEEVRKNNDYCADICSAAPDHLLGLCVLNPSPELAGGDFALSVQLMIEEATRCYHELGLRGVKMVPTNWYPNDPLIIPLYQAVADLGMYVLFHSGIFADAQESAFCRPAYFEAVHRVENFKGQLAHVGWPWVDECIAVMAIETMVRGKDPTKWNLKVDLSFGSPDDWQLGTWQHAIDSLPGEMLIYGSDVFWPCSAEEYREKYLQPQLGLYETAATLGHIAPEGSSRRKELRQQIFYENALAHWEAAVRQPQRPRRAAGNAVQRPAA